MQLSAKIIRLAVDVAKIGQPIIDLNTQQTPAIFAGTDVQIQLALFNNGSLVDVGNLAYLQIDLKTPSNLLGASVLTQQVNASALNNAANFSTWTAGTAQQAVFALSNLQTNFGISTPATYTLIISGATTDSPGHIIVFGQTQFTVTPTGLNSGGSPPPATPNFYTTSQSDGRYLLLGGSGQTVSNSVSFTSGITLGKLPATVSGQNVTLSAMGGTTSGATASVGPYVTIPTSGAANFGPAGGQTSIEVVNTAHSWRIRQNGTVLAASLYLPSATGITGFYAKIWRLNSLGTYDLVGNSENFASSLFSGSVSHTLATAIAGVREGDFIGFRAEYSNTGGAVAQNFLSVGAGTCFSITNTSALGGSYNWVAQTSSNVGLPLQVVMPAPSLVAIGDSQISGLVATSSYIDTITGYPDSPVDSMPSYLGRALGLTYQNMGIGGQTTSQIALRFAADAVAASPRFCLIEGGVNDIFYGAGSSSAIQATLLSNVTAMLTSCQAAGILPILCLIGPMATYGLATSTGIALRHSINTALQALGVNFNAIVVDWSSAIGQPTALDSSGDFSQLQAQYDSGDHLHPNSAGYARTAQVIAEALASFVLSGRGTFGGLSLKGNLAFEGSQFRRIEVERNPTYQAGGQALALRGGAAFLQGSNLAGGQLLLSSGISTGSGISNISFQTAAAGYSGTLDNLPTQCALLQQSGSFTQLALMGQANSQVDFWSGGTYQCACGFDAPSAKFAIYGSGSASAPVLTVDSTGNLSGRAAALSAGLTIASGGAAITGGLALTGSLTASGSAILGAVSIPASGSAGLCVVASGSSWLHASGCIANFYASTGSAYCGVWLGYNPSNNCGLIGANVAGTSNNNLAVCTDGGSLLIGSTSVPGSGATGLCLVASGSGWVHASSCIANFYANSSGSFRGVWLGYDVTNSCGVIGANTQGASNDNLALCSDGGNVIIGERPPITSGYMLQVGNSASGSLWVNGPAVFAATVKFGGTNTTGSGTAAFGANCPAGTASAPYTWIQVIGADGSTLFVPAWK